MHATYTCARAHTRAHTHSYLCKYMNTHMHRSCSGKCRGAACSKAQELPSRSVQPAEHVLVLPARSRLCKLASHASRKGLLQVPGAAVRGK